jgi:urocanate hydratase
MEAGRPARRCPSRCWATPPRSCPSWCRRGVVPDVVTDQTSAHDPLRRLRAQRHARRRSAGAAHHRPDATCDAAKAAMAEHVRAMLAFQRGRRRHLRLRQQPPPGPSTPAWSDAFDFPGFVPAFIRPLFCEGKGPFRWAALSGDPDDIARHRPASWSCSRRTRRCSAGCDLAREKVAFQGCRRASAGWATASAPGRPRLQRAWWRRPSQAPIVIGRDHLDTGSVAEPNRETEGMRDGSDAIADWPILNALVNTAGGATWVSFHHGGGVGIGYSQHAGMVIVADGTPKRAARRLERVLTTDPGMGVAAPRRCGLRPQSPWPKCRP